MTTSHQTLETLPPSIRDLILRIKADSPLTPAKAKRLLSECNIAEADLAAWVDYNHPAADSYGRKMVWDAGQYELMVMSWSPGDYSAIHDHGYTQWGAVKVFGNAEHAVFDYQEGVLTTQSRVTMPAGSVVSVANDLIHQMGNVTQPPYPTLHLYGNYDRASDVTADARIFALDEEAIQYTSGGVFFSLPDEKIQRREKGLGADFPTQLRYDVEMLRRLETMREAGEDTGKDPALQAESARQRLFSAQAWPGYREALTSQMEGSEVQQGPAWDLLLCELEAAAQLQATMAGTEAQETREAQLWDETLGPLRLSQFVAEYLRFLIETQGLDLGGKSVLSAGCRTGVIESHLLRDLGVSGETLLGIDPSASMIKIAESKLRARQLQPWELAQGADARDLILASVNSLQRSEGNLAKAVEALAGLTREGGLFVGDFLAPLASERQAQVDLSQDDTLLIEQSWRQSGDTCNRNQDALRIRHGSEGITLHSRGEQIDCELGIQQVRDLVGHHFGGEVNVLDATAIPALAQGATGRYLILARRGS